MIICNRCSAQGKVEPGERYVFNTSRLNAGRVPILEVHSVDACPRCAEDFWEAFGSLIDNFGMSDPVGMERRACADPLPDSFSVVPGRDMEPSKQVKGGKK